MGTPIALTIAGSDSGGGAGIQADLKTFSALGAYGASVITALTAQNTREVRAISDVPADFISAQMDTVFEDLAVDAVKIGMLSQVPVIEAVADGLKRHDQGTVVLDPVMVAKSGDALLARDAVDALTTCLLPAALLVTPNLPEAGVLLGEEAPTDEAGMRDAARSLHALGARNVLVKGGHLSGEANVDLLFDGSTFERFENARIHTANTHGTGCTLSSAIAAGLARGRTLSEAVKAAVAYVHRAIECADELEVGTGHGPVHHFHQQWTA